jgi:hypothetical protein
VLKKLLTEIYPELSVSKGKTKQDQEDIKEVLKYTGQLFQKPALMHCIKATIIGLRLSSRQIGSRLSTEANFGQILAYGCANCSRSLGASIALIAS